MTPQQVFEYKKRWQSRSNFSVVVCQDSWHSARQFCKDNYDPHQWDCTRFYNQDDSHLFQFESKSAQTFFVNNYHGRILAIYGEYNV